MVESILKYKIRMYYFNNFFLVYIVWNKYYFMGFEVEWDWILSFYIL